MHHGDPKAKRRFQKIGEAYHTLSDPTRRMQYHSSQNIKLGDKAAKQASKPRDVSKDGDMISHQGIMVGGSQDRLSGILAKKQENRLLIDSTWHPESIYAT